VRASVEAFVRAKGWTIVSTEPDLTLRLANRRIVRLDWEQGYPALRSDMASPTAKAVLGAASMRPTKICGCRTFGTASRLTPR